MPHSFVHSFDLVTGASSAVTPCCHFLSREFVFLIANMGRTPHSATGRTPQFGGKTTTTTTVATSDPKKREAKKTLPQEVSKKAKTVPSPQRTATATATATASASAPSSPSSPSKHGTVKKSAKATRQRRSMIEAQEGLNPIFRRGAFERFVRANLLAFVPEGEKPWKVSSTAMQTMLQLVEAKVGEDIFGVPGEIVRVMATRKNVQLVDVVAGFIANKGKFNHFAAFTAGIKDVVDTARYLRRVRRVERANEKKQEEFLKACKTRRAKAVAHKRNSQAN